MKRKLFLLHLEENFVAFNLIYWTHMSGSYFLYGSILEKIGNHGGPFGGLPDFIKREKNVVRVCAKTPRFST